MCKRQALRVVSSPEGLNNETGAPHGRTPASALTSYPDWASRKQKGNYPFNASSYKKPRLGEAPVCDRWHNSLVGKR
jgi:hypothetical protein